MKVLFLIIPVCFLISCTTPKQEDKSEPQKTVESFFATYKNSGPTEALQRLLSTNKYIKQSAIDTIANTVERLSKELGDYHGYDIVSIKSYGSIQQITCLAKYSQLPVRFTFKFYQPGNGWRIQDCNFQTNFLNDLEKIQEK